MTNIARNPNECRPRYLAFGVDDPLKYNHLADPGVVMYTRIPRRVTISVGGAAWTFALWDGLANTNCPSGLPLHRGGLIVNEAGAAFGDEEGVDDGMSWYCEDCPTAAEPGNCGLCAAVNRGIECIAGEPGLFGGVGYPTMYFLTYEPGHRTIYWPGFVDAPTISLGGDGNIDLPGDPDGAFLKRLFFYGDCSLPTLPDPETTHPFVDSYFVCDTSPYSTGTRRGSVQLTLVPNGDDYDNSKLQVTASVSFTGPRWHGGWSAPMKEITVACRLYYNRFGLPVYICRIPDSVTFDPATVEGAGSLSFIDVFNGVEQAFVPGVGDWQFWACDTTAHPAPEDEEGHPHIGQHSVARTGGPFGYMSVSFGDWFIAPVTP